MANYHINPETGNANLCRAKTGKCPYEKNFAEHYETKVEAQKAYEDQMEYPVSQMSRILILRYRTQNKISNISFNKKYSEMKSEERQKVDVLMDRRRKLDKAIVEMDKTGLITSDAGKAKIHDPLKIKQPILKREDKLIEGFRNTIEGIKKTIRKFGKT